MKTYHLRHHSGGWELRQTGSTDSIVWAKLKTTAIALAKKELKAKATHSDPVSLRICDKEGKVKIEWTYPRSADPKRSKG